jgi:hypothetical protein
MKDYSVGRFHSRESTNFAIQKCAAHILVVWQHEHRHPEPRVVRVEEPRRQGLLRAENGNHTRFHHYVVPKPTSGNTALEKEEATVCVEWGEA